MKFQEVLSQHNIPTAPAGHRHTRPGWVNFDCPFCGRGSGKMHMGYNLSSGYVHCWSCGGHRIIDTVMELTGLGFVQVRDLMGLVETVRKPEVPHTGRLVLPKGVGELLPVHRTYLGKRGFDPDQLAATWGIGGLGLHSRLAWRVFVPIPLNGRVVSWTTRAAADGVNLPYISASPQEEAVGHKALLYGEDLCRNTIIINEGPLDAWAVGPGGVATLGTGFTAAQLHRMTKYAVRVVVFDNDPTAQKRARRLASLLEPYPGETYRVELETGKDASRASKRELRELRKRFLD